MRRAYRGSFLAAIHTLSGGLGRNATKYRWECFQGNYVLIIHGAKSTGKSTLISLFKAICGFDPSTTLSGECQAVQAQCLLSRQCSAVQSSTVCTAP